jgi:hypothetical protein
MTYDLEIVDVDRIQDWWDGLDADLTIEWLDAWELRDKSQAMRLGDRCLASLPEGTVRPGAEAPYVAHPVFGDFLDARLAERAAG